MELARPNISQPLCALLLSVAKWLPDLHVELATTITAELAAAHRMNLPLVTCQSTCNHRQDALDQSAQ